MAKNNINVWLVSNITPQEMNFYHKICSDFGRKHGVDVRINEISWTKIFPKLVQAYKNNNPPDIFQFGTTWVNTLAHLGYLAEVPSFVDYSPVTQGVADCCEYKDKKVAVPWFIELRSILVNKKLQKKYNIDLEKIKTQQGFYEICKELSKMRQNDSSAPLPIAFPIRPETGTLNLYMSWIYASGWRFPDINNLPDSILGTDLFIKRFNYVINLIEAGNIDIEELKKHPHTTFQEFTENRFMFYMGNWQIKSLEESQYMVTAIPTRKPDIKRWSGGSVLCVSNKSKVKKLSWRLINTLRSDENLEEWVYIKGELPSFETGFWEKKKNDDKFKKAYRQIKNSIVYPVHPLWYKIEQVMLDGMSDYLWSSLEDDNIDYKERKEMLVSVDQKIKKLFQISWDWSAKQVQ